MNFKTAILLVILLQITIQQKNQKKITSLNILMPLIYESLDYRTVQYTMQAYGGCYNWSSSQPTILKVIGIKDQRGCENVANIQLATNSPYQSIFWLTVSDLNNHETMKVECRIDKISRIEITTKLRTIDVEALEELQITAYDSIGNTFSSLEGIRFEWVIEQQENCIEFVKLRETIAKTSDLRKELEQQGGFMTDMVVIKGLKTGQGRIIARLKEQGYNNIMETSVKINVIEQITMFPDYPLFILSQDLVQFRLYLIKREQKILEPIKLPSVNYKWLSTSADSKVDNSGLLKASSKINDSGEIIVTDQQTQDNQIKNYFMVVNPLKIEILIKEGKALEQDFHLTFFEKTYQPFQQIEALVINKYYYVKAFLYDDKKNSIYLQNHITWAIPDQYFRIIETRNHEVIIQPINLTDSQPISVSFKNQIDNKKLFSIVDPITLIKPQPILVLPNIVGQSLQLIALGGSKQYEWYVDNEDILTISQFGLCSVLQQGTAMVQVKDLKNQLNYDSVQIDIATVSAIQALELKKELITNQDDVAYIRALSQNGQYFTNCSSLTFNAKNSHYFTTYSDNDNYEVMINKIDDLRQKNDQLKELLPPSINSLYATSGICKGVKFRPNKRGDTTTQYYLQDLQSQEVQIKIFDPLSISNHHIILAYQSSYDILIEGGPTDWEDQSPIEKYQLGNSTQLTNDLSIQPLSQSNPKLYKLTCQTPTSKTLQPTFIYYNQPDLFLPNPKLLSVSVSLQCGIPKKLQINDTNTWLLSPHQHFINVNAYDENGRQYTNFTSLIINWELQSTFPQLKLVPEQQLAQLNVPSDIQGQIKLLVTSNKLQNSDFKFSLLQDQLILNIQQPIKLLPQLLLIYFDINNQQSIIIHDGSSEFHIQPSATNIVSFEERRKEIIFKPIQLGEISITVTDLKLAQSNPAIAQVVVAFPTSLTISIDSKFIQVGSYSTLSVEAQDSSGRIFSQNQMEFMKIVIRVDETNSITITKKSLGEYQVNGNVKGDYKIYAILTQSTQIYSNSIDVQVFTSLTTYPSNVLIAPDCLTSIELLGGPLERQNVYFDHNFQNSGDSSIAQIIKVDQRQFQVLAKRKGEINVSFNVKDDKKQLSQTSLKIVVTDPTSVRMLGINDRTIHIGATIRAIGHFYEHDTPMVVQQCPSHFQWTNKYPNIVQVVTNNAASSNSYGELSYQGEYLSALNVTGISEGSGELELKVKYKSYTFTSKGALKTIEALTYQVPQYLQQQAQNSYSLLLSVDTYYQLQSNYKQTKYTLLDCGSHRFQLEQSVIKTPSQKGQQAVLQLETYDHHSQIRQTSYLSVQTINVQSLFVKDSYIANSIQSDAVLNLQVMVQDENGRIGPASQPLIIRVFNSQCVEVKEESGLLKVMGKRIGESLVVVQLKSNTLIYDYFQVKVGSMIQPDSGASVHEGGLVKFSIKLENEQYKQKGDWSSSDTTKFQINQKSGEGKALKEGDVVISYEDSLKYSSKLKVFRANKIIRQAIDYKWITNVKQSNEYQEKYIVDFTLQGVNQEIIEIYNENGNVNNNLKGECKAQLEEWFKIESQIVRNSMDFQVLRCIIQPQQPYQAITKIPNNLQLTVKIQSREQQLGFQLTEQVNIETIWRLTVKAEDKTVYLNQDQTSKEIKIMTTHLLDVMADKQINSHLKYHYDDSLGLFIIQFQVPQQQLENKTEGKMVIRDAVTNIEETIMYYYEPSQGLGLNMFQDFSTYDLCLTLGVIFFTLVVMYNYASSSKDKLD